MPRHITVRLLLIGAALVLLAIGCLPPDPFDYEDHTSDELPRGVCRVYYEEVGPRRWQLGSGIWGSSMTSEPGELAAAELEIRLNGWAAAHRLQLRLQLEVVAGQALPGQALALRQDGDILQEAQLGGPHGNVAQFDLELPRDVCETTCTLTLSGPPSDSDVPVPLKMMGTLFATVDATRETRPCSDDELAVEVSDAP